jgi:hypothetical protein
MKNQSLVLSLTSTLLPASKLANHKPDSLGPSLVTLLFFSLLLSGIDSVRAASAKLSGPPPTDSRSCGISALARLADLLHAEAEASERILNTPAPQAGLSLSELQTLAAKNGIPLEAVRHPAILMAA